MTPTPLFPMELSPDKREEAFNSYMDKLILPILAKFPQEQPQNHVSVGVRSGDDTYSLYNPHNYRLYFDFDRTTLRLLTDPLTVVHVTYKLINTSEVCFPDYLGYRIVVKKTQIELTRKEDRWHIINLHPSEGVRPQIIKILEELNNQAIITLKKFILEFGGYSRLQILNATSENKVKHEHIIDTLPERMTFRNEIAKKVYMEQNVEFSDPVHASNYMANSAMQEIAPDINNALKGISEGLKAIVDTQRDMTQNALNPLTEQIKLHLKVQRATLKVMQAIKADLGQNKRYDKVRKIKEAYGW
jgi:hypothetical protein